MKEKESILQLLYFYPADYISAETLSRKLGIGKNKIHAYIRELRLEGYEIEGCTKRGYRLASAEDSFSAENIAKYYPVDKEKIRIFPSLPSTNSTAKEMALLGAPEGTVCIAEKQTEGRGRMNRSFFSPEKTGLYMSIILRPPFFSDAVQITAMSAVAVAETIEYFTNQTTQIKWVNDVYYKGKKVCGILAEGVTNPKTQKPEFIILGIGVNLIHPKTSFPEEINNIAGAVFDKSFSNMRSKFTAYLLSRFDNYYQSLNNKDFLSPYKKRNMLLGKKVIVNNFCSTYPATVLDINDDFSLKISLEDGTTLDLSSGEVSVKIN